MAMKAPSRSWQSVNLLCLSLLQHSGGKFHIQRLPHSSSKNARYTVEEARPSQGDSRLIALTGVPLTAACDNVHLGGVEIINNGRWGRICFDSSDQDSSFTIGAGVICGQLGVPFGSLL